MGICLLVGITLTLVLLHTNTFAQTPRITRVSPRPLNPASVVTVTVEYPPVTLGEGYLVLKHLGCQEESTPVKIMTSGLEGVTREYHAMVPATQGRLAGKHLTKADCAVAKIAVERIPLRLRLKCCPMGGIDSI